jgi:hypothetical protein
VNQPELWSLSLQAFGAVLVVLGLLAAAVRALTALFPPPPVEPSAPAAPPAGGGASDPFVLAAIHAAARQVAPDAVVVRVDEVPEGRPS